MSKDKNLEKQADRAETIADQTTDDEVKKNLRDAAKEYREKSQDESKRPS